MVREGGCLWTTLGRPRYVVAPMVEASELPWRLLSRRHGAHLCYTPMFHAQLFAKDPKYRKEVLTTCPQDRPLIVQFCGNKPEVVLEAARLCEDLCDAVDLNLGCPQAIARRGHYGAFLQDEWELVSDIVSTLSKGLKVPVTCKMRVFEDIQRTVDYAKMLEAAGCRLLTVHGRTREQKGPLTGIASWQHIKAVRENVSIPVLSNGNIQYLHDVERCLAETGCQGVMTAEGNLYNPALFEGSAPPSWELAIEYLDLVREYPCPPSYIRGHLFKMFHALLSVQENFDLREEFAKGLGIEDFRSTVLKLKERFLPHHEGNKPWSPPDITYNLEMPPWLSQPYVRMPPEQHLQKMAERQLAALEKENLKLSGKRELEGSEVVTLSKKKLKKLQKKPNATFEKRQFSKCSFCPNPMGLKCVYSLCKPCCREKCNSEVTDCLHHRILIKTKKERAKKES